MRAQKHSSHDVESLPMSTAELHISESALFATRLVANRRGGARDPFEAVARECGPGVPASRIRALVQRPRALKSIASHIREGLARAYAAECARQKRLLDHEIAMATAAGADPALLAALRGVAGAAPGEDGP